MALVVEEDRAGGVSPSISRQARGLAAEGREMARLSRGLVAYNLAYLALAWVVAAAAIAAFWIHPAWWTFLIAFVVVSSRQQALLNCEHECVHRKFLPDRRWNEWVGRYLCGGPVGSPFAVAQARHLSHHRLLATPEDPDRELHSGEPPKNTPLGLVRYFAKGLLGGYAVMVLLGPRNGSRRPPAAAARRDLWSLIATQGLLALVLTAAFAWWVYPALWLAPLATLTALCHLVRSFVEHAITRTEQGEHGNRLITIRSHWLERGLVAPYFMNYHAEHHLVPSVPAPRLRRLKQRLAARDETPAVLERRSYGGAIRHYLRELVS